ncbi:ABC transporter permease subunit [Spiroplasma endosymbiont of Aspidapion aeneum]|uniref:ABC transporter permease subunit n=1 Tax=Spiroplasma endosymbiont of Aspidapion aeneum TaxID=3066276 RepID=UPI00313CEE1B
MFNSYIFLKQLKGKWLFILVVNLIIILLSILVVFVLNTPLDKNKPTPDISTVDAALSQIMENQFALALLVSGCVLSSFFIVREIYTCSMTYIICSPVSRTTIISTKIIFMLFSILFGYIVNLIIVSPCVALTSKDTGFTIENYIFKLTGLYIFGLLLSAIPFFAAVATKTSTMAYVFGIGIPVAFNVAYIISLVSSDMNFLKYITFYTLFINPLMEDKNAWNAEIPPASKWVAHYLVLFIGSAGLYIGSAIVFKHKDLQL